MATFGAFSLSLTRAAVPASCCCCGNLKPREIPRTARASRIRAAAICTGRLALLAICTSCSRTGSSNTVHQGPYSEGSALRAIKGYTAVASDEATLAQSDVSAMAFLDKDLYAAGFDEGTNSTTVYRVRGDEATIVATVTGKVLSMTGFQSGLFVGLDTGFIKEVLGSGVQHPSVGGTPLSPVTRLRISSGILVALAGTQYITFNGSVFEENTF